MRLKVYLASPFTLIGFVVRGQNKTIVMETPSRSVTCKLTTPELQKRKATIIAELKALVVSRNELANGYGFDFEGSDEVLDKVHDFIKTERMCCDFFTFQLTVESDKVLLHITGGEGAKEFLKEEIDL
jgi:hypothetical protein